MAIVINEAEVLERAAEAVPPLERGDRLTRVEFERRYEAMRSSKKSRADRKQGRVFAVLQEGIASPEHGTFVAAVQKRQQGSV
jgi:uncharacterized protein YifE (UPF0438 family)